MLKTINDIELGSEVLIKENNTYKQYILTRKDQNGCELLRKYCVSQRRMHSSNVSVYENCEADQWLTNSETGFLSRFDSNLLSKMVNRSISTYTYGDTECSYIQRKCYLYSYGDIFGTNSTDLNPEVGILPALMINKGTSDANTARKCSASAEGSSVYWWLRAADSAAAFWSVNGNGAANNGGASNASFWMRPVLNVSPDTIVSDEGANIIYLLPEETAQGKVYLATEETVSAIRSLITPRTLDDILVYALDFVNDEIVITSGGLNTYDRTISN